MGSHLTQPQLSSFSVYDSNGCRNWILEKQTPFYNIVQNRQKPSRKGQLQHQREIPDIKKALQMAQFRKDHSDVIVGVWSVFQSQRTSLCSGSYQFNIIIEDIPYRISDLGVISVQKMLDFLQRTFRAAKQIHRHLGVLTFYDENMICVNKNQQCKLWINENLFEIEVDHSNLLDQDQQMTEQKVIESLFSTIQSYADQSSEFELFCQQKQSVMPLLTFNSAIEFVKNAQSMIQGESSRNTDRQGLKHLDFTKSASSKKRKDMVYDFSHKGRNNHKKSISAYKYAKRKIAESQSSANIDGRHYITNKPSQRELQFNKEKLKYRKVKLFAVEHKLKGNLKKSPLIGKEGSAFQFKKSDRNKQLVNFQNPFQELLPSMKTDNCSSKPLENQDFKQSTIFSTKQTDARIHESKLSSEFLNLKKANLDIKNLKKFETPYSNANKKYSIKDLMECNISKSVKFTPQKEEKSQNFDSISLFSASNLKPIPKTEITLKSCKSHENLLNHRETISIPPSDSLKFAFKSKRERVQVKQTESLETQNSDLGNNRRLIKKTSLPEPIFERAFFQ